MLKKEFFAKALAFAMVTGLMATAAPIGAAPVQVFADGAEAEPVEVGIDYNHLTLTITPGKSAAETGAAQKTDNYVFVEVMKKENDDKQGTVYPFPVNGSTTVKVDLSFLKITKDAYLRVWGDQSQTKVTLTVKAQDKKGKYKYVVQTFPERAETDTDATYQDKLIKYYKESFGLNDKLSYRINSLYGGTQIELADTAPDTPDGKWDFNDTSDQLANVKITGTTLIIREGAIEEERGDTNDPNKLIKDGKPMGVEVKVKVAAAPKAPKVTVDYGKGTLKIPKNGQYGIIDENGDLVYVNCANGGALEPKSILEEVMKATVTTVTGVSTPGDWDSDVDGTFGLDTYRAYKVKAALTSGFNLAVRTNVSNKGASNPTFVNVKEVTTLGDDGWGKITRPKEGSETTDPVIATYEFGDEGVTVKFDSGAFEYKEGTSWKKVASGKVIKGKTSEVILRQAGVKDKNEARASLPSDEIKLTKKDDKTELTVADAAKTLTAGAENGTAVTFTITTDRDGVAADDTEKDQCVDSAVVKSLEVDKADTVQVNGTTIKGLKAGTAKVTATVELKKGTEVVYTVTTTFDVTVNAASSGSTTE